MLLLASMPKVYKFQYLALRRAQEYLWTGTLILPKLFGDIASIIGLHDVFMIFARTKDASTYVSVKRVWT